MRFDNMNARTTMRPRLTFCGNLGPTGRAAPQGVTGRAVLFFPPPRHREILSARFPQMPDLRVCALRNGAHAPMAAWRAVRDCCRRSWAFSRNTWYAWGMSRSCTQCSGAMLTTARRDSRFCSGACRQASYRARKLAGSIPAELRAADRWMRFRLVPRGEKLTKVPTMVNGRNASSTAAGTWTTYAEAAASSVGAGLGFALGDGIGCLDLDDAVAADGTLSALAHDVLSANPDAWVELSVSGRGLHIWGLMAEAPGRVLPGIEVYSQGRFIALGTTYRAGGLHPLNVPELATA